MANASCGTVAVTADVQLGEPHQTLGGRLLLLLWLLARLRLLAGLLGVWVLLLVLLTWLFCRVLALLVHLVLWVVLLLHSYYSFSWVNSKPG
ncbi:hypothetical protein [Comamonas sp. lk]|uniref:hypothetical protein n=1 Tax=Comamonas sp. lk TaxID=2201272 RepID=UPI0019695E8A|nr:hypothetical protein [Comamonas sp. lk]